MALGTLRGSAVRLAPTTDRVWLTEGIEDALARGKSRPIHARAREGRIGAGMPRVSPQLSPPQCR